MNCPAGLVGIGILLPLAFASCYLLRSNRFAGPNNLMQVQCGCSGSCTHLGRMCAWECCSIAASAWEQCCVTQWSPMLKLGLLLAVGTPDRVRLRFAPRLAVPFRDLPVTVWLLPPVLEAPLCALLGVHLSPSWKTQHNFSCGM